MLAATTSARIRSACMALPEVSIIPKRFIPRAPPLCPPAARRPAPLPLWATLLVGGVNGVHDGLILAPQQRHAGLELQLRLGQIEALSVQGDVVAVGPRDQAVDQLDPRRARGLAMVDACH